MHAWPCICSHLSCDACGSNVSWYVKLDYLQETKAPLIAARPMRRTTSPLSLRWRLRCVIKREPGSRRVLTMQPDGTQAKPTVTLQQLAAISFKVRLHPYLWDLRPADQMHWRWCQSFVDAGRLHGAEHFAPHHCKLHAACLSEGAVVQQITCIGGGVKVL